MADGSQQLAARRTKIGMRMAIAMEMEMGMRMVGIGMRMEPKAQARSSCWRHGGGYPMENCRLQYAIEHSSHEQSL